jgi:NAD+ synthase (glutamine-hydrolysing)
MRIALAQLNPISGDIDGNTRTLIRSMEEAARSGAEIVVAPEMSSPGIA